MAEPKDPDELKLVHLAVTLSHVTGCCEWDEKAARRFGSQPPLPNLTPEGVTQLLHEYVVNQGGEIIQAEEKREEYSDRPFYYKVVIPVEGLRRGLFVELVLDDDDADCPVVRIVNAHEQGR
jgi:hypothetical protein